MKTNQRTNVQIRWLIRRDMTEVLQIERESFGIPWIEEDFKLCLTQRNCIGMVSEAEGRVVGFMIYELHKTRLHILNFAVANDFHRQGVGAQMVEKLIGKLSQHRRKDITIEIRETNLIAQLFFQSQDFLALETLQNNFDDSSEDAYLMRYRLGYLISKKPTWCNRISEYESL